MLFLKKNAEVSKEKTFDTSDAFETFEV